MDWHIGRVRISVIDGLGRRQKIDRPGYLLGAFGVAHSFQERNHRGEWLPWGVYHQPSGSWVTYCRTLSVAKAIVGELDALGIDWDALDTSTEVGRSVSYDRVYPLIARWACEGDALMSDKARDAALRVAGL